MNTTLCCRANQTKTIEHVETDMVDAKGRKIGYSVIRCDYDYVAVPAGQTWGAAEVVPGTHEFEGCVQPTRDGADFGACTPPCRASTAAERDAMVAKKLASGIARYAKKFAREADRCAVTCRRGDCK